MSKAIRLLRECLDTLESEMCNPPLAEKVFEFLDSYQEKQKFCQCGECKKHKEKYFKKEN